MSLWCVARSVGRRRSCIVTSCCYHTAVISRSRNSSKLATTQGNMLKSFEERVFSSAAKTFNSPAGPQTITIDEEYEEAIKALNSLQSNYEAIRRSIALNNKQAPLDDTLKYLYRSGLSLEDVEKLSFIHVAGTKGKGSTCALTESILRAHGFKTGFFSSPHLVSVTERIRLNGLPIAKEKFTRTFRRVFKQMKALQEHENDMPAYFKFLTILCFHIFLEEQVDVVVLEVGIGGEFDCTNIIRNTKTVGITSLGLEHTQLLGTTLPEIAWQKAGIIKMNSNVYTSVTQPECLKVVEERAKVQNATILRVPDYTKYYENPKQHAVLSSLNNVTQLNGSLAIQLAFDWLRNHKHNLQQNYVVNSTKLSDTVLEGLIHCTWPGRCQIVKYRNLNIHLDGAHTVESMTVCGNWFAKMTKSSQNPKVLIFNSTGDRDSKKLIDVLRRNNQFDAACFMPNISTERTNRKDNQSAYGITDQLKSAKMHAGNWHLLCVEADEQDNSHVFNSILDSFIYLSKEFGVGGKQQVDVLVTGSIHLIGATILALNEFQNSLP